MGEIVIEKVNYKAFVCLIINLLLLFVSAMIMTYGFRRNRISIWLPLLLISTALMIGFIILLIHAVQVKKLLTITIEGIVDNSTIGGMGFIPYEDIKEFVIVTVFSKKAIAVIPKNVDSFLSKLNVVRRRQIRRNLSQNLPPVTIFVNLAKDMEPEDILSLLQKRLSDYSSLYV